MITLTQSALIALIIKSFLFGVAFGGVNDIFRAIRLLCACGENGERKISVRAVCAFSITFFLDLVFWVSVGVASIVLMYSVGGGIFRGVTYLSMGAGFVLYYISISRLTLVLTHRAIPVMRRMIKKLFGLLCFPIGAAWKGIISLYRLTIGKIIGKIKEEKRLRRENGNKTENQEEGQTDPDLQEGGKEAFVYVSENCRYRREGRIRF